MTQLVIKLKRGLFDLFQHCELHCRASCCRWDAFDLSDHWLTRWCEFRDAAWIERTLTEIGRVKAELAARDPNEAVDLHPLFFPRVQSLLVQLENIERVLASYSEVVLKHNLRERS